MKVMLAGDWSFEFHEAACAKALEISGVEVIRHSWRRDFPGLFGKIERRFGLHGPRSRAAQARLSGQIDEKRPDVALLWRPRNFPSVSLPRNAQPRRTKLALYNNDSPFPCSRSIFQKPALRLEWRNYLRLARTADLCLAYRESDCVRLGAGGVRNAAILLPYYIDWLHQHRPLSRAEEDRYECDCVFVGHYEPDGRAQVIAQLIAAGLKIRIFGGDTWKQCREPALREAGSSIRHLEGDEYVKALNGAKIALCFFSKLNRDTYTRRCFEIPACRIPLLSEWSPDLRRFFADGEEIVTFRDATEAVAQATRLVRDGALRDRIATAGLRRVQADGHGVIARMGALKRVLERVIDAS